MKSKVQVQYKDINIDIEEIERIVKDSLKNQGVKMNAIESLQIYYKPEEYTLYYVLMKREGEVIKSDIYISK